MIGMVVFVGLLAASDVAPQQPAPAPAIAPAQSVPAAPALASNAAPGAAPDKSKLICETDDETGSRLAKHKTCLTSDQWREMRRQERLDVEHDQRIGRTGE